MKKSVTSWQIAREEKTTRENFHCVLAEEVLREMEYNAKVHKLKSYSYFSQNFKAGLYFDGTVHG